MRAFQLSILILLGCSLFACGNRPLAPVGTLDGDNTQSSRRTTPSAPQPTSTASKANTHTRKADTQATQHIVKQGDTLYSISWRYGQEYKKLAAYNGINPPYTIHRGQKIRLPGHKAVVASQPHPFQPVVQPAPILGPPQQHIIWRWPTAGKVIEFYSTREPGNKGIDIAGKLSQPVYAAASGKVVYGGNGLPRYGNLLIIKHDDVYLSAYAHNQILLVKEGQQVVAGQKIALLGKTGTQRHKLHFEIRYDGRPINPLPLLPKR